MRPLLRLMLCVCLAACGSTDEPTPIASPADEPPEVEAPVAEEVEVEEPHEETAEAPAASAAATDRFASSTREFGVALYQRLRTTPGNLVISPGSMSLAFAMTYAGARGETAEQMAQVLHFGDSEAEGADVHAAAQAQLARWNDPERETYELRVVNRLFAQQGMPLEAGFVSTTGERYGAPIEALNFAEPEPARLHINAWVAEQTNERIEELLPEGSLTALSRLVLTNAVYFLGAWANAFDEDATRERPFHVDASTSEVVPMMHQQQTFGFAHSDGVSVLEMPYVGEDLSMVVILPDAEDGLSAVEENLSAAQLEAWVAALRPVPSLEVALPRFRVEMQAPLSLRPHLSAMGMPLPFQRDADFTAMSNPSNPDEQLHIDDAFHRAFIEVTEAGTEAAAATAVVMATRGGRPAVTPPFVANHPFLYAIRDVETGSLLFLGRVSNPAG